MFQQKNLHDSMAVSNLLIDSSDRMATLSIVTPLSPKLAPPLRITKYTVPAVGNLKVPPVPTQPISVKSPSKGSPPQPSHVFNPILIPPSL